MKKIYLIFTLVSILSHLDGNAQTYLPLTGGTLTGSLIINLGSGNQLQTPYLGLDAAFTQPTTSSNVALFASSTSNALDIVGYANGWHFVPGSTYPSPVLTIDPAGNTNILGHVGIGTTSPLDMLDVSGNFSGSFSSTAKVTAVFDQDHTNLRGIYLGYDSSGQIGVIAGASTGAPTNIAFWNYGGSGWFEAMRLTSNGNLIINQISQANTAYKLDVNGSVRANSIVVNTTGADFVFNPKYQLKPLPYVQKYISENHHLPGIASAKEMQTNGLNLGDNQTKLLQKVEELTLYLIDKDKQIDELKQQVDAQKKVDKSFQKQVNVLEKLISRMVKSSN